MTREQQKSISLANCNIEGDKHLREITEFLKEYSPDVVCFQEAIEQCVSDFAHTFNNEFAFRSCALLSKATFSHFTTDKMIGLAILSKIPFLAKGNHTYIGDEKAAPIYQRGNPNSVRRELLYATIAGNYKIATTHFTWAPNGTASEEQLRDVRVFIEKASLLGECVITGDFNAPRPNSLYQSLSKHFHDDIPLSNTTSLDPRLHRVGRNGQMLVDYIFSTPTYAIEDVKYVEGISDHMAILAQVSRKNGVNTA